MKPNRFTIFLYSIAVLFIACGLLYAAEDGFNTAKRMEGKHFLIFYDPLVDLVELVQKLDIGPSESLLAEEPAKSKDSLAMALDILFNRVCSALDMNLYSFQGNLKICRDKAQLNSIHETIFNSPSKAESFYVDEYNTIYTSAESFTKVILGHEIAHMIISHYFVVQPPHKAAEILAGYVEYQLRKGQAANSNKIETTNK